MSSIHKVLKDLGILAEDALHTVVSPIEGPINNAIKDVKDIYKTGKDITGGSNNSQPTMTKTFGKQKRGVKRKFTGDPLPSAEQHRAINSGIHGGGDPSINQITMSGKGAGGATDGDVAVVPIPRQIAKSHPDYFTINLPIYVQFQQTLTNTTSIAHYWLRLNSVYDVFVGGTADTYQPFGRDTWAGIYDYYRVIKADVNLVFDYRRGEFGSDQTDASQYVVGSNCTHALVGYAISDDTTDKHTSGRAFVEGKHTKVNHLYPRNYEVTKSNTATSTNPSFIQRMYAFGGETGMSFHYEPENWDYHVQNTGVETRWTAIGANPTQSHYLGMVIAYPQNDGTLAAKDKIIIGTTCYVNFTVQFREVNSTKKRTVDTTQA